MMGVLDVRKIGVSSWPPFIRLFGLSSDLFEEN